MRVANCDDTVNGESDYQALIDLFETPVGTAFLGYARGGSQQGRLVVLRPINPDDRALFSQVLPRVRQIARPSLTKLLALADLASGPHLVSEYVVGASLAEVRGDVLAQGGLPIPVVVRIVLDLLQASVAARAELRRVGAPAPQVMLKAQSAWVAAYGEGLLTELGIAGLSCAPPTVGLGECPDVHAAGILLWELTVGRSFAEADPLGATGLARLPVSVSLLDALGDYASNEMVELLMRALSSDPSERFQSAEALRDAIWSLPPSCVATEEHVAQTVERLSGASLEARQPDHVLGRLSDRSQKIARFDSSRAARAMSVSSIPAPHSFQTVRPAAQTLSPPGPLTEGGLADTRAALPPPTSRARKTYLTVTAALALLGIGIGLGQFAAVGEPGAKAVGESELVAARSSQPAATTDEPAADPAHDAAGSAVSAAPRAVPTPEASTPEPSSAAAPASDTEPTPPGTASSDLKEPKYVPSRGRNFRPRGIAPYRPKGI